MDVLELVLPFVKDISTKKALRKTSLWVRSRTIALSNPCLVLDGYGVTFPSLPTDCSFMYKVTDANLKQFTCFLRHNPAVLSYIQSIQVETMTPRIIEFLSNAAMGLNDVKLLRVVAFDKYQCTQSEKLFKMFSDADWLEYKTPVLHSYFSHDKWSILRRISSLDLVLTSSNLSTLQFDQFVMRDIKHLRITSALFNIPFLSRLVHLCTNIVSLILDIDSVEPQTHIADLIPSTVKRLGIIHAFDRHPQTLEPDILTCYNIEKLDLTSRTGRLNYMLECPSLKQLRVVVDDSSLGCEVWDLIPLLRQKSLRRLDCQFPLKWILYVFPFQNSIPEHLKTLALVSNEIENGNEADYGDDQVLDTLSAKRTVSGKPLSLDFLLLDFLHINNDHSAMISQLRSYISVDKLYILNHETTAKRRRTKMGSDGLGYEYKGNLYKA